MSEISSDFFKLLNSVLVKLCYPSLSVFYLANFLFNIRILIVKKRILIATLTASIMVGNAFAVHVPVAVESLFGYISVFFDPASASDEVDAQATGFTIPSRPATSAKFESALEAVAGKGSSDVSFKSMKSEDSDVLVERVRVRGAKRSFFCATSVTGISSSWPLAPREHAQARKNTRARVICAPDKEIATELANHAVTAGRVYPF